MLGGLPPLRESYAYGDSASPAAASKTRCSNRSCLASPDLAQALLVFALVWPAAAEAAEALVLGRDTLIRLAPHVSGRVVETARPGETYEIPSRRTGKGQPLYVMDERGELWVKVRVDRKESGFVRTDLVSVAREEYGSPVEARPS